MATEAELRLQYGRLLVFEIDGLSVFFRPLTPTEANRLLRAFRESPEDELEIAFKVVKDCCVLEQENLEKLMEEYPLSFIGATGVIGKLVDMARGDASATITQAKKKWQEGQRNLGHMAEQLLAFKGYTGGDYTADQFAGAMHTAEGIDVQKGTFKLLQALMKALSKR